MKTKQDENEFMIKAIIARNRFLEQESASNHGDYKFPWWVNIPIIWMWLIMLFIWTSVAIDIFNSIFK